MDYSSPILAIKRSLSINVVNRELTNSGFLQLKSYDSQVDWLVNQFMTLAGESYEVHQQTKYNLETMMNIACVQYMLGKRYPKMRSLAVFKMPSVYRPLLDLKPRVVRNQVVFTRTKFKEVCKEMDILPAQVHKGTPLSDAIEQIARGLIKKKDLRVYLRQHHGMTKGQVKQLLISSSVKTARAELLREKDRRHYTRAEFQQMHEDSWATPVATGETQYTSELTHSEFISALYLFQRYIVPRVKDVSTWSDVIKLICDGYAIAHLMDFVPPGFEIEAVIEKAICLCVVYLFPDMFSETMARASFCNLAKMDPYTRHMQPTDPPPSEYTGLFEVLQKLKESQFLFYLRNLIIVVSSMVFTSVLFKDTVVSKTLEPIFAVFKTVLDVPDVATACSEVVLIFREQIIPCIALGSLEPLKPIRFRTRAVAIETFILCAEMSFPRDLMVETVEHWNGKDETLSVLDDVTLKMTLFHACQEMIAWIQKAQSDYSSGSLAVPLQSLLAAKRNLDASIKSAGRVMPFCVGICGPPATGKTTFLAGKMLAYLAAPLDLRCNTQEGSLKPPLSYVVVPNQEFQENASYTTQVIGFDDMGQVAYPPGSDPAFGLFFDIQSNVPVQIPKASLNAKRDMYWNNVVTWASTNDKNFGSRGKIQDAEAFFRRFHVLCETSKTAVGYSVTASALDYYRNVRLDARVFEASTLDGLYDLLGEYIAERAWAYQEFKTSFRQRVDCSVQLCKQCKLLRSTLLSGSQTECRCGRINLNIPDLITGSQSGLACFASHWLRYCDTTNQKLVFLFVCAVLEESFFLLLNMRYGWDHILLVLGRILLDVCVNFTRVVSPMWLILQLVLGSIAAFNVLPFSITMHFLINVLVYSSLFYDLKVRCLTWFFNQCNQSPLGQYVHVDQYNITPSPLIRIHADQIMDMVYDLAIQKIKSKLPRLSVVIGALVSLASFRYIFTLWNSTTSYTSMGFEPMDIDKEATLRLQSMVSSGYRGQMDGLTNSWPMRSHGVFVKSPGTEPKPVQSNVVTIVAHSDPPVKFKGYYSDGYIYTVRHPFLFQGEVLCDVVFPNGDQHRLSINLDNKGMVETTQFDLIRIFFQSNRKSLKAYLDYVPSLTHTLMVNGEECKIQNVLKKSTISIRNTTYEEPEGALLLSVKSKAGLSGSPVFLIADGDQKILPVFVGVLSRCVSASGQAIMVRISLDTSYTMLPFVITSDMVRADLTRWGFKYKMVSDHRSVLNHLDSEDLNHLQEYCCSLDKPPFHNVSQFKRSHLYEKALSFNDAVSKYGIPFLRPHKQDDVWVDSTLACLRQMASCGTIVDQTPFTTAANVVYQHVISIVRDDLVTVSPLTIFQAIRGTTHTNPLNLSAGFGYPHLTMSKNDAIVGTYDEPYLTSQFANEIVECLVDLDNGKPVLNVSFGTVKDEITSLDKISKGLERVFFAGNTHFLFLCRMYLAPYMDIFMKRRNRLFGQIGMNACGRELNDRLRDMYYHIESGYDPEFKNFLDEEGWLDSDWDKYDKRLLVLSYGIYILWRLVLVTPFYQKKENVRELNRIRLILQSFQQFVVVIGNDVFLFDKRQPSGVFGTTWINCFCEAILEVLQFYYCKHLSKTSQEPTSNFVEFSGEFFRFVSLINYGDDNLKYVSRVYRDIYTHANIMKFAQWIQMGITPARKHDTQIFFKKVTDVMFLKRTPIFYAPLGVLVGRLEFNSIGRMLAFTDSSDESWETMVLDQAKRELAIYPGDIFQEYCRIFGQSGDQFKLICQMMVEDKWIQNIPSVPFLMCDQVFDMLDCTDRLE